LKVRIFAGTGGVGKTSVSAAAGIRTAMEGGRCLVLTIDPAARLKTALGMDTSGEQRRVPLDSCSRGGELWAAQIDVKAALEQMVRRLAKPENLNAILANRLYQALGSMAGMQELMAIERIGQALGHGFDSIIVDTAPSRHALEFLDKPEYLARLLSAPLVKLAGRTYQWWAKSAMAKLGRVGLDLYGHIERLVGAQLTRDALEFFSVFQGVAESYAREAEKTLAVLRDPEATGFTLVSTPFKARADAAWFLDELQKRKFTIELLVINRVWPELRAPLEAAAEDEEGEAQALLNWYRDVSLAHARATEAVRQEFRSKIPRLLTLRELSTDVDGIHALHEIANALSA
jgi:anion-transporting  ArsA/GET3 family ATPase